MLNNSDWIYGEKFYARPYRVADLLLLEIRQEQIEFHYMIKDKLKYSLMIERTKNPFTVLDYDDNILLIGGINPTYNKIGEGFFLLGSHFEKAFLKEPIRLTKGIKKYIIESEFDRVQTTVRSNFDKAEKLVRLLGFQKEGTMRKGGFDGNDLYMYGWVRE